MSIKTVLIIDDNELNLKLCREILKIGKYDVLEATDAMTGIQLADEHNPDLILMDLGLPDMDGIAATVQLKKSSKTTNIPIVALSGYNLADVRYKALNAGCSGFIPKPIKVKTFLGTIADFI